MSKIVAISKNNEEWKGFNSEENPQGAGKILIGYPAEVDNDNILSHQTKGKVSGFSVNAAGNYMVHLHWLDGAPPLRIKPENLKINIPTKFYMVVAVTQEAEYSRSATQANLDKGSISPVIKFASKEIAIERAKAESARVGLEMIVLETTVYVSGSDHFAL